ncbi:glutamate-5-semialdehyde dehydrogenase [Candidatus Woesearchaeota archaeon]|nr:glutamate-5-semialdehyde dehydrogenase [Candidatus Woesearchaeota archaeon]
MSLRSNVLEECEKAKEAAQKLLLLSPEDKQFVLFELAQDIVANAGKILAANKKDTAVSKSRISPEMLKRLQVDKKKIYAMAEMVRSVAGLEDPAGKIISATELDEGLLLKKISVPLGVVCCIFESRPEAVVQISALAIKSGNAVLLKGGSEALHTNRILTEIIRNSIKDNKGMPEDAVQLLETREAIREVLKMDGFIDLVIPRGSSQLVRFVQDNTRIPVMGHAEGVCTVYIDKDADLPKAVSIACDAKCQYPAACNAAENLIVHRGIAEKFIPAIAGKYLEKGVELRGDEETLKIMRNAGIDAGGKIKKASEKDWSTEYNGLIISIKVVSDVQEAIAFINRHGSGHTDSIVTENHSHAKKFLTMVDSSSVMWNASTRFADGYRYGLGAEVGISTGKIHARGPVGVEGLVTHKWILEGKGRLGHIVAPYAEGKRKFKHAKIK